MKITGFFLSLVMGISVFLLACNRKATSGSDKISDTSAPLTLHDSISAALDYQMSHYPVSQYRDVYKSFMQDYFGPGHILADTAASGRYLRNELSVDESFSGPVYEPTGYRGNFYRVNLSVIRDGLVPYDIFFKTFVESIRGIVPPEGDEWMKTWAIIDEVIKEKNLHFENEESDRAELSRQFSEGNYVVHHSARYNDSVHFHYRIISRDNFEKVIRPLIER